jgi:hypothetical protein
VDAPARRDLGTAGGRRRVSLARFSPTHNARRANRGDVDADPCKCGIRLHSPGPPRRE